MMNALKLPPQPRILVVVLRRLGDVLLTTPVIRSLRRVYPDARIDVLVFAGTEGILEGNPDINTVITMPARPGVMKSLALAWRLWRRYDLAVSTQSGDRPVFFSWAAGRRRAGPVEGARLNAILKRLMLDRPVVVQPGLHRVVEGLRLIEALGLPAVPEVVAPGPSKADEFRLDGAYAVIHAAPMYRYKRWTHNGWRQLAAKLEQRGLILVSTGGPAIAERSYLDEVWDGCKIQRLDGTLTWPQLATLIKKATVYIGPDTSVTHLAAATGCRTIALYGPTDPRLWAPWPSGGLNKPWAAAGTIQRRGNVWVVQNPLPCLPCQKEGCERRLESHSQCLDELSVVQVLAAIDEALPTIGR